MIEGLTDAVKALEAERDENTERVPLTTRENMSLALRIEALEKPKAEERIAATQAKPGEKVGDKAKVARPEPKERYQTRDVVGKAVGISGSTFTRGKAVFQAAEAEPEKYGDLFEVMNKRGIIPAYLELKRRREAEQPTAQPAQQNQREWAVSTGADSAQVDKQGKSVFRTAKMGRVKPSDPPGFTVQDT